MIIQPTKCPLCSFESKKTTTINRHVNDEHGFTPKQAYDNVYGATLCKCGCEKETKFINVKKGYSSLIKGHNGSIYSVCSKEHAETIARKRSDKLKNKQNWSKGLTKETDDRIKKRAEQTSVGRKQAFDNNSISVWSKGLTKETDDRIRQMSDTIGKQFKINGRQSWIKGLTKETDPRVASMSVKCSISHLRKNLRHKLDQQKRLDYETIKDRVESKGSLALIDIGDYKNDKERTIVVSCNSCGSKWTSHLTKLAGGRCINCHPAGSIAQEEIVQYIKSLGLNPLTNDRTTIINESTQKGLELDIHVPDKNFAIEYNGLYFHSDLHKSNIYHQSKTTLCKQKNIKLMHVFEDEWSSKQAIVKSMISHRVGLTKTRINARACSIKELTISQRRDFFNNNHIDSDVNSMISWGLFDEKLNLVSAMSMRKAFHRKYKTSIEVARICTALDVIVRGGLSRLTQHACEWARKNVYDSVITYVDTRHGADTWENSKWKLIETTPPRWWWTDHTKRYNRFKYRADKKNGLSEKDVALDAGVFKIWGCENLIYEIICTNERE